MSPHLRAAESLQLLQQVGLGQRHIGTQLVILPPAAIHFLEEQTMITAMADGAALTSEVELMEAEVVGGALTYRTNPAELPAGAQQSTLQHLLLLHQGGGARGGGGRGGAGGGADALLS